MEKVLRSLRKVLLTSLPSTTPTRELWQVKYAHDLGNIRRSEVVLNLDCVQRGLGNASCGPVHVRSMRLKR